MRSLVFLIPFLILLGSVLISAQSSSLGSIPGELRKYQTAQGGFADSLDAPNPTAKATGDALFLYSLFDLDLRVDDVAAAKFLQDLHRNDGGYASSPSDASSTVQSTHAAVFGILAVNPQADVSSVGSFLKSVLNSATGFASPRVGDAASLEATVAWFELASQLNLLHQEPAQSAVTALKTFLSDRDTEEDSIIFFENDGTFSNLSPVAFNSLAIRLGELIGYEFGEDSLKKWASYFNGLQDSRSGCFFDGPDAETTSLASTAHATRSLYTLHRLSHAPTSTLAKTDLRTLQQCLASTTPATVSSVALGHQALAFSTFFGHYFNLKPSFEIDAQRLLRDGETIIQGSQLAPGVMISTDFGPHSELKLQAVIEIADNKVPIDLAFDAQTSSYRAAKGFDTTSAIGPITISFVASKTLPLIGTLSFARRESKLIGYGIEVTPTAHHAATGREILPTAAAPAGTIFLFNVQLSTATNPVLTSGAFTVHLKVVEPSGSVLHTDSIDGEAATEGLTFQYTLDRANLAPGTLSFEFSVESHARRGAHTHYTVSYLIETTLAASDIDVSAKSLSIGDRLAVSFEPVIVLDSGSTLPFGTEGEHEFYLDLVSPAGHVVHSALGSALNERISYSVNIPANVNFFTSSLSLVFRYHPTAGKDSTLAQIDEQGAEVEKQSVSVQTELVLTEVAEKSPAASYTYGDEVSWSFSLSDALSNTPIVPSSASGRSGIFISLSHGSGDDSFFSAKLPVHASGNTLSATFPVTANALSGAATLAVEVLNIDGKVVPITGVASHPVTISGSVHADSKAYSSALITSEKAVFIADFTLSSGSKPLNQAELHAIVYRGSELISSLAHVPVAATPSGYSVSFALPLEDAPSGQYEIRIVRTQEYRHFLQLTNDFAAASKRVHPIHTITHYHSTPVRSYIGVPTEYLVIAALGFVSFKVVTTYAVNKKKQN